MKYLGGKKGKSNRKRHIPKLSEEARKALETEFKTGKKHRERQRAEAILLSESGIDMNDLAVRFGVNRDTINRWLDGWEERQMAGLREGQRSGRPPIIPKDVQKKLRTKSAMGLSGSGGFKKSFKVDGKFH